MHISTKQKLSHFRVTVSTGSRECASSPEKEMFSADEVLMFREGWIDVEDEKFLRYLRQHWLLGPSRGPPKIEEPSKNGTGHFSQNGQSEFVDEVSLFKSQE